METLTYTMNGFTTEELIGEVLKRTGDDVPALRLVEGVIIQARLAAGDRLLEKPVARSAAPFAQAAVRGTTEMGFADDVERALLPGVGHEVDPATPDSHTHDHTHGKKATWRLAAHEHHHVHGVDDDADGQLNGHVHARAHAKLPWESFDSDR